MKINKSELRTALEIVKPGLANKEIIEQTTSFAFIDGKVITYNDEISISHPVGNLELVGAIKAEELYKFLGKSTTEEIDIQINGEEIVLKTGRSKVGFPLKTDILLPINEELSIKGKWKSLPKEFLEAVKFAALSCSKDMSIPKLTCVHLNKKGIIEGSDSYRIAHWDIGEELPIKTILVPASSLIEMLKIKPTHVSAGNGWIHFKNKNNTIFSCRSFEDTFPDLSVHLKPQKDKVEIKFPENMDSILEKAQIFVEGQHINEESVAIIIGKKQIQIESQSEKGWFKESISIANKEKDISFSITPYLLKDILKQTNQCYIANNTLIFKGTNWIYLTSLRQQN